MMFFVQKNKEDFDLSNFDLFMWFEQTKLTTRTTPGNRNYKYT